MEPNNNCEMIHEDLVFQILMWLPVASLLRFKSVCKAWLSHIDSSRFISQHTHRLSSSEDNKLVVVNSFVLENIYFKMNFVSVNNLQLFKYVEFSPFDYYTGRMSRGWLVASFHGVICLYQFSRGGDEGLLGSDVVSLWNPATTQFTTLPPPQSDIKVTLNGPRAASEYGVGFDVKNNDYKVVRAVLEYDLRDYTTLYRSQVEVYSLSTDSWRIIDDVWPLNFVVVSNPRQPLQNDIYCWSGYDKSSSRSVILTFDFTKEVFGIMPVPDVCSNSSEYKLILAFLRDKISIFCINESYSDHCEIWVLDKYGVKESWTNPYKIMLDQEDRPMGFSMDGKVVLIRGKERKLSICDPITQEVNEVPTQECIDIPAVYKESLISVKSAAGVTKKVIYEGLSKMF